MRFSLQVHYAVSGLFDLAYNGLGEAVQVRVMSERQQVPARYLEQIFQRLRRANLVAGKRGPGGGYRLARPPGEITLLDVVEAVEGPIGGGADDGRAAPAAVTDDPRPRRIGGGGRASRKKRNDEAAGRVAALQGRADAASTGGAPPLGGPDFVWPELSRRFAAVLAEITLADLCRSAARRGVPRLSQPAPNYQI